MGWLFMSRGGMSPFATPKAYLDNQCTYPPDPDKGRETGLRVLKSTVRSGAYYAACQSYDADGPKRDLCDHLPRQMEPRRAQRGRVRLQGQCAVAALKRSIKDDEVS
jgi:hypothetical protein